jgi:uncharacterized membrane protein (UPF0127 family)
MQIIEISEYTFLATETAIQDVSRGTQPVRTEPINTETGSLAFLEVESNLDKEQIRKTLESIA